MAENRTFQFYGLGYGETPVTLTASIDGIQIFSGEIPTANVATTPQPTPLPVEQDILFTIANSAPLNTDFAGMVPMTVVVTGGSGVILGEILSNYVPGNLVANPGAGTANVYNVNYVGNPTNSEGTQDARSSVQIDGVTQVPPLPASTGCWNWWVPTGSTITHNWNIGIGQVANVAGNVTNYSGSYTTIAPVYPS